MKLAAIGSNCIDYYNNIDGGRAYPGGGPVNMACLLYTSHAGSTKINRKPPVQSRGSVRKQRREGPPFARLHRQTASTTTKGAFGVFSCIRIKRHPFPVRAVAPRNFDTENRESGSASILLAEPLFFFLSKIPERNRRFLTSPRPSRGLFLSGEEKRPGP